MVRVRLSACHRRQTLALDPSTSAGQVSGRRTRARRGGQDEEWLLGEYHRGPEVGAPRNVPSGDHREHGGCASAWKRAGAWARWMNYKATKRRARAHPRDLAGGIFATIP